MEKTFREMLNQLYRWVGQAQICGKTCESFPLYGMQIQAAGIDLCSPDHENTFTSLNISK